MRKVTCDSCAVVRINGVICHERGCPNAWRDSTRRCFDCGFDFTPTSRYQKVCDTCLADREGQFGPHAEDI
jgi:hypothetical protein